MQLEQTKPGDRLSYRGLTWTVTEHSTYKDRYGYQTEEWSLKLAANKEYYLLKEVDPENPMSQVNWYLAEKLENVKIYLPNYEDNIYPSLWQVMQDQAMPYPELKMFDRSYFFESRTTGTYQEDGTKDERITWDYWDLEHQYNLAIEAWANQDLFIYNTQKVNPDYFSFVSHQGFFNRQAVKVFILCMAILFIVIGCSLIFS